MAERGKVERKKFERFGADGNGSAGLPRRWAEPMGVQIVGQSPDLICPKKPSGNYHLRL